MVAPSQFFPSPPPPFSLLPFSTLITLTLTLSLPSFLLLPPFPSSSSSFLIQNVLCTIVSLYFFVLRSFSFCCCILPPLGSLNSPPGEKKRVSISAALPSAGLSCPPAFHPPPPIQIPPRPLSLLMLSSLLLPSHPIPSPPFAGFSLPSLPDSVWLLPSFLALLFPFLLFHVCCRFDIVHSVHRFLFANTPLKPNLPN